MTSTTSETSPHVEEIIDLAEIAAATKKPVERNIAKVRKLLSKFVDEDLQTDLLVLIFENMRRKKMFTDMKFICQECGEVTAHKAIVSIMSEYCQRIFEEDSTASVITLPHGITTDSAKRLLDFMYTGELPIPDGLVQIREVMKAARFLELRLFDEAVAACLKKSITLENFRNIWELAEDFNNEFLSNTVVNSVSKDFLNLGNHREMGDLSVGQLQMLLRSRNITVNSPEEILEALLSWIHRDSKCRITEFEKSLLPLVSFQRMPVSYLRSLLETESLVNKCPSLLKEIEKAISTYSPSPRNKRSACREHAIDAEDGMYLFAKSTSPFDITERRPTSTPPTGKKRRNSCCGLSTTTFTSDFTSGADSDDEYPSITFPSLFSPVTNPPSAPNRSPSPPKPHRPNVTPQKRDIGAKRDGKGGGTSTSSEELRIFIFGRKRNGEPALQSCLLPSGIWGPAVDLPTLLPVNASVAVYQNHIYFAGGNDWLMEAVDDFVVYNIRQSSIKRLSPLIWARTFPASAILGWYMYVLGGLQTDLQGVNKVERYNVFAETWETRAPLLYAAGNISVVAVDIRLYCFGGCRKRDSGADSTMDWLNELSYYDHEVNQWTMLGNITSGLSNNALTICFALGKVYITKSIKPEALWSFNLTTLRWKYHCGSVENRSLQRMLTLIPQGQRIWAIDCAGKMYLYDLTSQSWAHEVPFTHSIPCPAYAVVGDCSE